MRRHCPLICALLPAFVAVLTLATPCHALRVCTYNVLNWPDDFSARVDAFRTVMDSIDADLIVIQEVQTWQSANLFLNDVLNYSVPGEYRRMPFVNGPDTDNACFFKPDVLDSLSYDYLDTGVRYTTVYTFRPDGYASSEAEFTILSTHLKAGTSGSDESERLASATVIRNYLNDYPSGSSFMVAGDFNIQASSEGSYQMLIGYQADNDGRSKDPIATGGTWHDNYSLRHTHTQSPRVDGGSGTGGGMDDRFDFILVSYALDDDEGLSYVDYSYTAFGNDGQRFNLDINDPPNIIVTQEMADALYDAADHIPVFLELQVPARVEAPAALAFGDVIVGTAVEESLTVGNVADDPADALEYSLSAPAGFSAPGGSYVLWSGQENIHDIIMDTATVGLKAGDLEVSSNDLDDPTWLVALEGTVVDHASPSLSPDSVVLGDTLDFGSVSVDSTSTQSLSVHNEGYDMLQAALEVYDASIVGGDGRFSFVGGFTPKTAGSSSADYALEFDASGAAEDSLYLATLTLSTRDHPSVTGGTNLADLTVELSCYVTDGTSVPDDQVLRLALSPGSPNPFTARTSMSLAIPEASKVSVAIYDVSGRKVATLVDATVPQGTHAVTWDGVDDAGRRMPAGIYFARAEAPDWSEARKLVLLR